MDVFMVSENWAVLRLLDLVQVNLKIGISNRQTKTKNN